MATFIAMSLSMSVSAYHAGALSGHRYLRCSASSTNLRVAAAPQAVLSSELIDEHPSWDNVKRLREM